MSTLRKPDHPGRQSWDDDWRGRPFPFPHHQKGNKTMSRPIYDIAVEIRANWPKVYFGAVPYLDAMCAIKSINDQYGCDSAKSVVIYFLSNAQTWRGEVARRIKAELKALAGIK